MIGPSRGAHGPARAAPAVHHDVADSAALRDAATDGCDLTPFGIWDELAPYWRESTRGRRCLPRLWFRGEPPEHCWDGSHHFAHSRILPGTGAGILTVYSPDHADEERNGMGMASGRMAGTSSTFRLARYSHQFSTTPAWTGK